MKTSLTIDADAYKEAKIAAAKHNTSISSLVNKGLRWAVRDLGEGGSGRLIDSTMSVPSELRGPLEAVRDLLIEESAGHISDPTRRLIAKNILSYLDFLR